MRYIKRVGFGVVASFVLLLLVTAVALAVAVGDVTNLTGNPSDTSIVLTWTKASGSTGTLIRQSTSTYPTLATGTLTYNGTGFQCTSGNVTNPLTPGQVYYFSAWGYASGNYSANATHLAMSTLAVPIPSGAGIEPTIGIPAPPIPSNVTQNATIGAFHLEPFTSIVSWFVNAPGGLGMPEANVWEVLAIGVITLGGLGTYIRIRNVFVGFAVSFLITVVCVGLHLVQGWLVPIEVVVAGGVWSVERFLQ